MAKKKIIDSVTLKNPDEVITLPRIGMVITKDNLTLERYEKLISISPSFKELFNLKLKKDEVEIKK